MTASLIKEPQLTKPDLEGRADKMVYVREINHERLNCLVNWLCGQVKDKFTADEAIHVLLNHFEVLHPGSTLPNEKGGVE